MQRGGELPATAYLTAVARAEATANPSSDLDDPYAARFAELCPPGSLELTRRTLGTSVVVARTVIVDRVIRRALAEAADDPVEVFVNLGAGFDARPYRLEWPEGCEAVEVDVAEILDVKERLLPAAESPIPLSRLTCDIRATAELARLLAPRLAGRHALILTEGLLVYFPEPAVGALATMLSSLSHRMDWICDVVSVASASALASASRAAGSDVRMHGLTDLGPVEAAGWRCDALELLPSARAIVGGMGRPVTSAASRLPDSVVWLTAENLTEQPV